MFEDVLCLFGLLIILVPFFLLTLHSSYNLICKAIGSNSADYRIKGHEFYGSF